MSLENKVKPVKSHIPVCSICQDYAKLDDKGKRVWYTPTPDERRFAYRDGFRLTHGSCYECTILQLEIDGGYTPEEIKHIADKYK